jgi:hypothetical protein
VRRQGGVNVKGFGRDRGTREGLGNPRVRRRRASGAPAFTVTGNGSRIRLVTSHGAGLPRLNHSEAGRLQTFPSSFPWTGRNVAQHIGNAVPPLLGAALDMPAPANTCSGGKRAGPPAKRLTATPGAKPQARVALNCTFPGRVGGQRLTLIPPHRPQTARDRRRT